MTVAQDIHADPVGERGRNDPVHNGSLEWESQSSQAAPGWAPVNTCLLSCVQQILSSLQTSVRPLAQPIS